MRALFYGCFCKKSVVFVSAHNDKSPLGLNWGSLIFGSSHFGLGLNIWWLPNIRGPFWECRHDKDYSV